MMVVMVVGAGVIFYCRLVDVADVGLIVNSCKSPATVIFTAN